MRFKKISVLFLALFFSASFLSSQSLVEIAKKEKERRESLKEKKVMVVTNQDLRKVKKKTALSVILTQPPEKETEIGRAHV